MTIWTFGDSFSKHFPDLPDTWLTRTGRILGQDIVSFSRPMTTLEYSFFKFNEQRANIQPNDIVIMSITTLRRRWFFPDRPFRGLELNDKEKRAYENYEKYLHHFDEIHKVFVANSLYNLHYLTKKLNLHTIVLPNFHDFDPTIEYISKDIPLLNISKGRAGILSDNEFKPEIVGRATAEWFMKVDKRINHFIKTNHLRIADKVVENIKNKTPIDFTTGMVTGILDDEMFNDSIFCEQELFSEELKRIKI